MHAPAPTYLFDPRDKPNLPLHRVPLIIASDETLQGYGQLVEDPEDCEIEIVRWPAQGWRPVDEDSGNEGGLAEGIFHGAWRGDVLMGRNEAVGTTCWAGAATRSRPALRPPAPRAKRCCCGT